MNNFIDGSTTSSSPHSLGFGGGGSSARGSTTTPSAREEPSASSYPPSSDDTSWWSFSSLIQGLYRWIVNNWVEKLLLPALFTALRFFLFFLLSVILYVFFYRWMVPTALAQEPVYFDYSQTPPIARVNLVTVEKQWSYVDGRDGAGASKDTHRQFLRSDFSYMIDASFRLSKSHKNYELGKFMVFLDVVDSTGASTARSARPVAVPYQSSSTLWLDSVCMYPLRVLGFTSAHESSTVDVSLMNAYWERAQGGAATEVLELTLGSSIPDIVEATVTVMPVMKGLTSYMWHYPVLSTVIGVAGFTSLQIGMYMTYLVLSYAVTYVRGAMSQNGNDSDRNESVQSSDRGGNDSGSDDDDEEGSRFERRRSASGERDGGETGSETSDGNLDSDVDAEVESRDTASASSSASVSDASPAPSQRDADLFAESQAIYNRSAAGGSASRENDQKDGLRRRIVNAMNE